MTLPDPSLDRPGGDDLGQIDRLPPSERSQDELRTETTHGLATDGSRPLTGDERTAAEHDTPLRERVYAPASERVPVDPVPGHRDFIEHTDEATPERQAAHETMPGEPSFTRVERPSNSPRDWSSTTPTYSSETFGSQPRSRSGGWFGLPLGIGMACVVACGAVGAWLVMRWQRERNRPINRMRRQALQAWQYTSPMRERMPSSPDELRQPAGFGAAASLLPIVLIMWRIMQGREERRPIEQISDADWQQRLMHLKDRWSQSLTVHR